MRVLGQRSLELEVIKEEMFETNKCFWKVLDEVTIGLELVMLGRELVIGMEMLVVVCMGKELVAVFGVEMGRLLVALLVLKVLDEVTIGLELVMLGRELVIGMEMLVVVCMGKELVAVFGVEMGRLLVALLVLKVLDEVTIGLELVMLGRELVIGMEMLVVVCMGKELVAVFGVEMGRLLVALLVLKVLDEVTIGLELVMLGRELVIGMEMLVVVCMGKELVAVFGVEMGRLLVALLVLKVLDEVTIGLELVMLGRELVIGMEMLVVVCMGKELVAVFGVEMGRLLVALLVLKVLDEVTIGLELVMLGRELVIGMEMLVVVCMGKELVAVFGVEMGRLLVALLVLKVLDEVTIGLELVMLGRELVIGMEMLVVVCMGKELVAVFGVEMGRLLVALLVLKVLDEVTIGLELVMLGRELVIGMEMLVVVCMGKELVAVFGVEMGRLLVALLVLKVLDEVTIGLELVMLGRELVIGMEMLVVVCMGKELVAVFGVEMGRLLVALLVLKVLDEVTIGLELVMLGRELVIGMEMLVVVCMGKELVAVFGVEMGRLLVALLVLKVLDEVTIGLELVMLGRELVIGMEMLVVVCMGKELVAVFGVEMGRLLVALLVLKVLDEVTIGLELVMLGRELVIGMEMLVVVCMGKELVAVFGVEMGRLLVALLVLKVLDEVTIGLELVMLGRELVIGMEMLVVVCMGKELVAVFGVEMGRLLVALLVLKVLDEVTIGLELVMLGRELVIGMEMLVVVCMGKELVAVFGVEMGRLLVALLVLKVLDEVTIGLELVMLGRELVIGMEMLVVVCMGKELVAVFGVEMGRLLVALLVLKVLDEVTIGLELVMLGRELVIGMEMLVVVCMGKELVAVFGVEMGRLLVALLVLKVLDEVTIGLELVMLGRELVIGMEMLVVVCMGKQLVAVFGVEMGRLLVALLVLKVLDEVTIGLEFVNLGRELVIGMEMLVVVCMGKQLVAVFGVEMGRLLVALLVLKVLDEVTIGLELVMLGRELVIGMEMLVVVCMGKELVAVFGVEMGRLLVALLVLKVLDEVTIGLELVNLGRELVIGMEMLVVVCMGRELVAVFGIEMGRLLVALLVLKVLDEVTIGLELVNLGRELVIGMEMLVVVCMGKELVAVFGVEMGRLLVALLVLKVLDEVTIGLELVMLGRELVIGMEMLVVVCMGKELVAVFGVEMGRLLVALLVLKVLDEVTIGLELVNLGRELVIGMEMLVVVCMGRELVAVFGIEMGRLLVALLVLKVLDEVTIGLELVMLGRELVIGMEMLVVVCMGKELVAGFGVEMGRLLVALLVLKVLDEVTIGLEFVNLGRELVIGMEMLVVVCMGKELVAVFGVEMGRLLVALLVLKVLDEVTIGLELVNLGRELVIGMEMLVVVCMGKELVAVFGVEMGRLLVALLVLKVLDEVTIGLELVMLGRELVIGMEMLVVVCMGKELVAVFGVEMGRLLVALLVLKVLDEVTIGLELVNLGRELVIGMEMLVVVCMGRELVAVFGIEMGRLLVALLVLKVLDEVTIGLELVMLGRELVIGMEMLVVVCMGKELVAGFGVEMGRLLVALLVLKVLDEVTIGLEFVNLGRELVIGMEMLVVVCMGKELVAVFGVEMGRLLVALLVLKVLDEVTIGLELVNLGRELVIGMEMLVVVCMGKELVAVFGVEMGRLLVALLVLKVLDEVTIGLELVMLGRELVIGMEMLVVACMGKELVAVFGVEMGRLLVALLVLKVLDEVTIGLEFVNLGRELVIGMEMLVVVCMGKQLVAVFGVEMGRLLVALLVLKVLDEVTIGLELVMLGRELVIGMEMLVVVCMGKELVAVFGVEMGRLLVALLVLKVLDEVTIGLELVMLGRELVIGMEMLVVVCMGKELVAVFGVEMGRLLVALLVLKVLDEVTIGLELVMLGRELVIGMEMLVVVCMGKELVAVFGVEMGRLLVALLVLKVLDEVTIGLELVMLGRELVIGMEMLVVVCMGKELVAVFGVEMGRLLVALLVALLVLKVLDEVTIGLELVMLGRELVIGMEMLVVVCMGKELVAVFGVEMGRLLVALLVALLVLKVLDEVTIGLELVNLGRELVIGMEMLVVVCMGKELVAVFGVEMGRLLVALLVLKVLDEVTIGLELVNLGRELVIGMEMLVVVCMGKELVAVFGVEMGRLLVALLVLKVLDEVTIGLELVMLGRELVIGMEMLVVVCMGKELVAVFGVEMGRLLVALLVLKVLDEVTNGLELVMLGRELVIGMEMLVVVCMGKELVAVFGVEMGRLLVLKVLDEVTIGLELVMLDRELVIGMEMLVVVCMGKELVAVFGVEMGRLLVALLVLKVLDEVTIGLELVNLGRELVIGMEMLVVVCMGKELVAVFGVEMGRLLVALLVLKVLDEVTIGLELVMLGRELVIGMEMLVVACMGKELVAVFGVEMGRLLVALLVLKVLDEVTIGLELVMLGRELVIGMEMLVVVCMGKELVAVFGVEMGRLLVALLVLKVLDEVTIGLELVMLGRELVIGMEMLVVVCMGKELVAVFGVEMGRLLVALLVLKVLDEVTIGLELVMLGRELVIGMEMLVVVCMGKELVAVFGVEMGRLLVALLVLKVLDEVTIGLELVMLGRELVIGMEMLVVVCMGKELVAVFGVEMGRLLVALLVALLVLKVLDEVTIGLELVMLGRELVIGMEMLVVVCMGKELVAVFGVEMGRLLVALLVALLVLKVLDEVTIGLELVNLGRELVIGMEMLVVVCMGKELVAVFGVEMGRLLVALLVLKVLDEVTIGLELVNLGRELVVGMEMLVVVCMGKELVAVFGVEMGRLLVALLVLKVLDEVTIGLELVMLGRELVIGMEMLVVVCMGKELVAVFGVEMGRLLVALLVALLVLKVLDEVTIGLELVILGRELVIGMEMLVVVCMGKELVAVFGVEMGRLLVALLVALLVLKVLDEVTIGLELVNLGRELVIGMEMLVVVCMGRELVAVFGIEMGRLLVALLVLKVLDEVTIGLELVNLGRELVIGMEMLVVVCMGKELVAVFGVEMGRLLVALLVLKVLDEVTIGLELVMLGRELVIGMEMLVVVCMGKELVAVFGVEMGRLLVALLVLKVLDEVTIGLELVMLGRELVIGMEMLVVVCMGKELVAVFGVEMGRLLVALLVLKVLDEVTIGLELVMLDRELVIGMEMLVVVCMGKELVAVFGVEMGRLPVALLVLKVLDEVTIGLELVMLDRELVIGMEMLVVVCMGKELVAVFGVEMERLLVALLVLKVLDEVTVGLELVNLGRELVIGMEMLVVVCMGKELVAVFGVEMGRLLVALLVLKVLDEVTIGRELVIGMEMLVVVCMGKELVAVFGVEMGRLLVALLVLKVLDEVTIGLELVNLGRELVIGMEMLVVVCMGKELVAVFGVEMGRLLVLKVLDEVTIGLELVMLDRELVIGMEMLVVVCMGKELVAVFGVEMGRLPVALLVLKVLDEVTIGLELVMLDRELVIGMEMLVVVCMGKELVAVFGVEMGRLLVALLVLKVLDEVTVGLELVNLGRELVIGMEMLVVVCMGKELVAVFGVEMGRLLVALLVLKVLDEVTIGLELVMLGRELVIGMEMLVVVCMGKELVAVFGVEMGRLLVALLVLKVLDEVTIGLELVNLGRELVIGMEMLVVVCMGKELVAVFGVEMGRLLVLKVLDEVTIGLELVMLGRELVIGMEMLVVVCMGKELVAVFGVEMGRLLVALLVLKVLDEVTIGLELVMLGRELVIGMEMLVVVCMGKELVAVFGVEMGRLLVALLVLKVLDEVTIGLELVMLGRELVIGMEMLVVVCMGKELVAVFGVEMGRLLVALLVLKVLDEVTIGLELVNLGRELVIGMEMLVVVCMGKELVAVFGVEMGRLLVALLVLKVLDEVTIGLELVNLGRELVIGMEMLVVVCMGKELVAVFGVEMGRLLVALLVALLVLKVLDEVTIGLELVMLGRELVIGMEMLVVVCMGKELVAVFGVEMGRLLVALLVLKVLDEVTIGLELVMLGRELVIGMEMLVVVCMGKELVAVFGVEMGRLLVALLVLKVLDEVTIGLELVMLGRELVIGMEMLVVVCMGKELVAVFGVEMGRLLVALLVLKVLDEVTIGLELVMLGRELVIGMEMLVVVCMGKELVAVFGVEMGRLLVALLVLKVLDEVTIGLELVMLGRELVIGMEMLVVVCMGKELVAVFGVEMGRLLVALLVLKVLDEVTIGLELVNLGQELVIGMEMLVVVCMGKELVAVFGVEMGRLLVLKVLDEVTIGLELVMLGRELVIGMEMLVVVCMGKELVAVFGVEMGRLLVALLVLKVLDEVTIGLELVMLGRELVIGMEMLVVVCMGKELVAVFGVEMGRLLVALLVLKVLDEVTIGRELVIGMEMLVVVCMGKELVAVFGVEMGRLLVALLVLKVLDEVTVGLELVNLGRELVIGMEMLVVVCMGKELVAVFGVEMGRLLVALLVLKVLDEVTVGLELVNLGRELVIGMEMLVVVCMGKELVAVFGVEMGRLLVALLVLKVLDEVTVGLELVNLGRELVIGMEMLVVVCMGKELVAVFGVEMGRLLVALLVLKVLDEVTIGLELVMLGRELVIGMEMLVVACMGKELVAVFGVEMGRLLVALLVLKVLDEVTIGLELVMLGRELVIGMEMLVVVCMGKELVAVFGVEMGRLLVALLVLKVLDEVTIGLELVNLGRELVIGMEMLVVVCMGKELVAVFGVEMGRLLVALLVLKVLDEVTIGLELVMLGRELVIGMEMLVVVCMGKELVAVFGVEMGRLLVALLVLKVLDEVTIGLELVMLGRELVIGMEMLVVVCMGKELVAVFGVEMGRLLVALLVLKVLDEVTIGLELVNLGRELVIGMEMLVVVCMGKELVAVFGVEMGRLLVALLVLKVLDEVTIGLELVMLGRELVIGMEMLVVVCMGKELVAVFGVEMGRLLVALLVLKVLDEVTIGLELVMLGRELVIGMEMLVVVCMGKELVAVFGVEMGRLLVALLVLKVLDEVTNGLELVMLGRELVIGMEMLVVVCMGKELVAVFGVEMGRLLVALLVLKVLDEVTIGLELVMLGRELVIGMEMLVVVCMGKELVAVFGVEMGRLLVALLVALLVLKVLDEVTIGLELVILGRELVIGMEMLVVVCMGKELVAVFGVEMGRLLVALLVLKVLDEVTIGLELVNLGRELVIGMEMLVVVCMGKELVAVFGVEMGRLLVLKVLDEVTIGLELVMLGRELVIGMEMLVVVCMGKELVAVFGVEMGRLLVALLVLKVLDEVTIGLELVMLGRELVIGMEMLVVVCMGKELVAVFGVEMGRLLVALLVLKVLDEVTIGLELVMLGRELVIGMEMLVVVCMGKELVAVFGVEMGRLLVALLVLKVLDEVTVGLELVNLGRELVIGMEMLVVVCMGKELVAVFGVEMGRLLVALLVLKVLDEVTIGLELVMLGRELVIGMEMLVVVCMGKELVAVFGVEMGRLLVALLVLKVLDEVTIGLELVNLGRELVIGMEMLVVVCMGKELVAVFGVEMGRLLVLKVLDEVTIGLELVMLDRELVIGMEMLVVVCMGKELVAVFGVEMGRLPVALLVLKVLDEVTIGLELVMLDRELVIGMEMLVVVCMGKELVAVFGVEMGRLLVALLVLKVLDEVTVGLELVNLGRELVIGMEMLVVVCMGKELVAVFGVEMGRLLVALLVLKVLDEVTIGLELVMLGRELVIGMEMLVVVCMGKELVAVFGVEMGRLLVALLVLKVLDEVTIGLELVNLGRELVIGMEMLVVVCMGKELVAVFGVEMGRLLVLKVLDEVTIGLELVMLGRELVIGMEMLVVVCMGKELVAVFGVEMGRLLVALLVLKVLDEVTIGLELVMLGRELVIGMEMLVVVCMGKELVAVFGVEMGRLLVALLVLKVLDEVTIGLELVMLGRELVIGMEMLVVVCMGKELVAVFGVEMGRLLVALLVLKVLDEVTIGLELVNLGRELVIGMEMLVVVCMGKELVAVFGVEMGRLLVALLVLKVLDEVTIGLELVNLGRELVIGMEMLVVVCMGKELVAVFGVEMGRLLVALLVALLVLKVLDEVTIGLELVMLGRELVIGMEMLVVVCMGKELVAVFGVEMGRLLVALLVLKVLDEVTIGLEIVMLGRELVIGMEMLVVVCMGKELVAVFGVEMGRLLVALLVLKVLDEVTIGLELVMLGRELVIGMEMLVVVCMGKELVAVFGVEMGRLLVALLVALLVLKVLDEVTIGLELVNLGRELVIGMEMLVVVCMGKELVAVFGVEMGRLLVALLVLKVLDEVTIGLELVMLGRELVIGMEMLVVVCMGKELVAVFGVEMGRLLVALLVLKVLDEVTIGLELVNLGRELVIGMEMLVVVCMGKELVAVFGVEMGRLLVLKVLDEVTIGLELVMLDRELVIGMEMLVVVCMGKELVAVFGVEMGRLLVALLVLKVLDEVTIGLELVMLGRELVIGMEMLVVVCMGKELVAVFGVEMGRLLVALLVLKVLDEVTIGLELVMLGRELVIGMEMLVVVCMGKELVAVFGVEMGRLLVALLVLKVLDEVTIGLELVMLGRELVIGMEMLVVVCMGKELVAVFGVEMGRLLVALLVLKVLDEVTIGLELVNLGRELVIGMEMLVVVCMGKELVAVFGVEMGRLLVALLVLKVLDEVTIGLELVMLGRELVIGMEMLVVVCMGKELVAVFGVEMGRLLVALLVLKVLDEVTIGLELVNLGRELVIGMEMLVVVCMGKELVAVFGVEMGRLLVLKVLDEVTIGLELVMLGRELVIGMEMLVVVCMGKELVAVFGVEMGRLLVALLVLKVLDEVTIGLELVNLGRELVIGMEMLVVVCMGKELVAVFGVEMGRLLVALLVLKVLDEVTIGLELVMLGRELVIGMEMLVVVCMGKELVAVFGVEMGRLLVALLVLKVLDEVTIGLELVMLGRELVIGMEMLVVVCMGKELVAVFGVEMGRLLVLKVLDEVTIGLELVNLGRELVIGMEMLVVVCMGKELVAVFGVEMGRLLVALLVLKVLDEVTIGLELVNLSRELVIGMEMLVVVCMGKELVAVFGVEMGRLLVALLVLKVLDEVTIGLELVNLGRELVIGMEMLVVVCMGKELVAVFGVEMGRLLVALLVLKVLDEMTIGLELVMLGRELVIGMEMLVVVCMGKELVAVFGVEMGRLLVALLVLKVLDEVTIGLELVMLGRELVIGMEMLVVVCMGKELVAVFGVEMGRLLVALLVLKVLDEVTIGLELVMLGRELVIGMEMLVVVCMGKELVAVFGVEMGRLLVLKVLDEVTIGLELVNLGRELVIGMEMLVVVCMGKELVAVFGVEMGRLLVALLVLKVLDEVTIGLELVNLSRELVIGMEMLVVVCMGKELVAVFGVEMGRLLVLKVLDEVTIGLELVMLGRELVIGMEMLVVVCMGKELVAVFGVEMGRLLVALLVALLVLKVLDEVFIGLELVNLGRELVIGMEMLVVVCMGKELVAVFGVEMGRLLVALLVLKVLDEVTIGLELVMLGRELVIGMEMLVVVCMGKELVAVFGVEMGRLLVALLVLKVLDEVTIGLELVNLGRELVIGMEMLVVVCLGKELVAVFGVEMGRLLVALLVLKVLDEVTIGLELVNLGRELVIGMEMLVVVCMGKELVAVFGVEMGSLLVALLVLKVLDEVTIGLELVMLGREL
ncbi:unnamed protein product, partial [Orchesella dallaii]